MRDALIFLKEMLTDIRAFEVAATGSAAVAGEPTPKKMSTRGREMIESLNEPLGKMVSWLRLNDRDLLDQTAAITIMVIDRFARSRITVNSEVVKRLRKLAEKVKDPKSRKDQLLKTEQIYALLAALSRHPDHSDEFSQALDTKEAKRATQKNSWEAVMSGKGKGPASVDIDDDDDEVLITGSKPAPSKDKSRSVANGSTSKIPPASGKSGFTSKALANGPTFKVSKTGPTPSKHGLPSGKNRLPAPTTRNQIYSHAAMQRARERSSDEDSDEDQMSGLARLAEKQQKMPGRPINAPPTLHQQQEQRKTKMLDLQGREIKQRGRRIMSAAEAQAQSQNKARLRYNPDYTELHRQILQWNVLHEGTTPSDDFRYPKSIPQSFGSPDQYIATFFPLLLLECWNEICTGRDEILQGTSDSEPITNARLAGRATVDDFIEIFLSVERLPERSYFHESDIVLLRGSCQTLGKIQQVLHKNNKIDLTIRCHLGRDNGTVSRNLINGTIWTVHKLFS